MHRLRSHARRFPRLFWVLVAGEAVENLGLGLIAPYVGLYLTGTLHASPAAAGVVLALYSFVSLGANPLGGVLADRVGRRPAMLAGLSLGGVAATGFGLVSGLYAAAAFVVAWSLAASVFEPAATAYVADVVEPELRTEAYALWRVVANASVAVGPPLGALLVWLWSIRLTFILAGIASLAYLVIAVRGLPETRPEWAAHEPVPRFRQALRDRALVALGIGTFLTAYLYAQYEDVFGVFLHEERGFSIATWGLVFGLNPLLVTVFQYPIARRAAGVAPRVALSLGALLSGTSFLLFWLLHGLGFLVLAVVVFTVGEMLIAPVATSLAAELAPERLRGSYQAVLSLAWGGAGGPSMLVGFWLVGRGQGDLMLAIGVPIAVAGALAYLRVPGGASARGAAARAGTTPAAS